MIIHSSVAVYTIQENVDEIFTWLLKIKKISK